jgi:hypothetical protein
MRVLQQEVQEHAITSPADPGGERSGHKATTAWRVCKRPGCALRPSLAHCRACALQDCDADMPQACTPIEQPKPSASPRHVDTRWERRCAVCLHPTGPPG